MMSMTNRHLLGTLAVMMLWALMPRFALAAVDAVTTAATAATSGETIRIPSREGIQIPLFWAKPIDTRAAATLLLLSGGAGGIGNIDASGWPGSSNFLIRSGRLFAAAGFNVAMMGRPSDGQALDFEFRTSDAHLADLRAVLRHLKKLSSAPVWLVGTSRGTISAAAIGIAEHDSKLIDGMVLTASVTSFKRSGAVPRQAIHKIRVPVLVVHHAQDACAICQPHEVPLIMKGLIAAPVSRQVMLSGGSGATGDPCEALHYHGFIGIEQQAVDVITAWVRHPQK